MRFRKWATAGLAALVAINLLTAGAQRSRGVLPRTGDVIPIALGLLCAVAALAVQTLRDKVRDI